jgi:hypothetical protein
MTRQVSVEYRVSLYANVCQILFYSRAISTKPRGILWYSVCFHMHFEIEYDDAMKLLELLRENGGLGGGVRGWG